MERVRGRENLERAKFAPAETAAGASDDRERVVDGPRLRSEGLAAPGAAAEVAARAASRVAAARETRQVTAKTLPTCAVAELRRIAAINWFRRGATPGVDLLRT